MKKSGDILARVPGFRGLPPEDLEKIESIAIVRTYRKGEVIFSEEDDGDGFFVVAKGRVKVLKVSPEGREVILHVCGVGDHFGQVAVYAGRTFPAGAEALAQSELLFFPRQAFLELIGREPNVALSMLSVLSIRLRELTMQVENLALKEVPGRLASYLLYLAEKQNDRERVTLDTSKAHLASMLGTTPETLSRILSDMAVRGLIGVDRREVTLRDSAALEDLAEQGRYGG